MAIAVTVDSRVAATNIALGVQLFHESGVHAVTTTNFWLLTEDGQTKHMPLDLVKGRQTFLLEYPHLFLGEGKYFINVGVSPRARHFSPMDQLLRENRCATLEFYRPDSSNKQIYDPPATWRALGSHLSQRSA